MMDDKSIGLTFETVIMLHVGNSFLCNLTVMAKDPANSISAPFARKPRNFKSHKTINCCLNELGCSWLSICIFNPGILF